MNNSVNEASASSENPLKLDEVRRSMTAKLDEALKMTSDAKRITQILREFLQNGVLKNHDFRGPDVNVDARNALIAIPNPESETPDVVTTDSIPPPPPSDMK